MSIGVVITYTCDKCGKTVVESKANVEPYCDESIYEPEGWDFEYPDNVNSILVCEACKSK